MNSKRLFLIFTIVLIILLIPFMTMQFNNEVSWSIIDFILAGSLLFVTGIIINHILTKIKGSRPKLLLILVAIFLIFLVFMELGVGIFNTPFAGN
ncbi:MAG: hypothetical protein CL663_08285 [Bacteroidetes bacterium]|nr:hypothetical protein [Bacteroidota bacterium]